MNRIAATSIRILLGALAIAAGAHLSWSVPGSDVPVTFQTLAVVCVAAWLGSATGAAAAAVYLGLGLLGLPVYSDGAAGWAVLAGPTGGYLAAFPPAAALVGWFADRNRLRRFWLCAGSMAVAHLLILAIGATRLAFFHGAGVALQSGVLPFLLGAAIKSGLGASGVRLARSFYNGRARTTPAHDRAPGDEFCGR